MIKLGSFSRDPLTHLYFQSSSRSLRQKLKVRAQVLTPRTVFLLLCCIITFILSSWSTSAQKSQANMCTTIIPESKTRWEIEWPSGSWHEGNLGTTLASFPWFSLISVSVWLLGKSVAIESCVSHLTSWGRLKWVGAIGKLVEIRQIWEAIKKILGLMGFGKYLQNWTRHWPGCHGNQQGWEVGMSAPVRKVLPKVLGDHINSQPTFGLEISLSCYIANLQHGAENISGVKSVL